MQTSRLVSERDAQAGSQFQDFAILGENEEETFKQPFSFENPSLLNNLAARLDLLLIHWRIKDQCQRGNRLKSVGYCRSTETQGKKA